MPYDQVLLPLLGGYFFIRRFHLTAYSFAGFSGYRLIMSSAIVGVFLALVAAGIIHVIHLSQDPEILHIVLIAPTSVGLLMLIFGSWKAARALQVESPHFDTDSPGDFERRERSRWLHLMAAVFLFILSAASIVRVVSHGLSSGQMQHLPALAGWTAAWVFAAIWFTFYVKVRSELHGYQVAFRLGSIAVIACGLFLFAYAARYTIESIWMEIVPFDYAGTAMLAMALGVVGVWPGNILFPYKAAINRLYENKRLDGIESLFYYAGITFQQVIVSLKDSKFYVGYVDSEIPIAGRTDEYVTIIPTASGHRDVASRTLRFTTFYLEPFKNAIEDSGSNLVPGDLAKVIPLSEVISVGVFDPDLYERFQDGMTQTD